MPVDPKTAERWNQALTSVYYHGRKTSAPFRAQALPRSVIPLGDAVGILASAEEAEAIRPVRMALADLCRTRAAGSNLEIDLQIERLAVAFHRLATASAGSGTTQTVLEEEEVLAAFKTLFSDGDNLDPHQIYVRAMALMVRFQPGPPDRVFPSLDSWEVTPR